LLPGRTRQLRGTDVFILRWDTDAARPSLSGTLASGFHNPNAAPVNVTFRLLLRDQANPSAQVYNDTIQAGDTRRYDDALAPCSASQPRPSARCG